MMAKRFLIVDDHAITRLGVRGILSGEFPEALIGEAQNMGEALALVREQDWDLVVLDLTLPGGSGVGLLKSLKAEFPNLPVLVFSFYSADHLTRRVLKLGAADYLSKDSSPEELARAVRAVLQRGSDSRRRARNSRIERREDQSRLDRLSEREYEVFCRIAAGQSVSEIAQAIGVSVRTVSTYRQRLAAKMHLRTNEEFAQYAAQNPIFALHPAESLPRK
jgi:DNA-binding NarL/FixJ family response regulator